MARPSDEFNARIKKELQTEHEMVEIFIDQLVALIKLNPGTSSEYYECLKVLGAKLAWIKGKLGEYEWYESQS